MSAAGTFNAFLDIVKKEAVYSRTSSAPFTFPYFRQGDTVPFVVEVLKFNGVWNSYSNPAIDGMTLQFTLTDLPSIDPTGATALVSQYSWTRDTNLKQFSADVAFTGAGLNTWLAGGQSKPGTVRFVLVEGTNTTTIYQSNVTIYAGATAVLTTPATETPCSLERALATFVKKVQDAGDYEIKTDPNGGKYKYQMGTDTLPHWDAIT